MLYLEPITSPTIYIVGGGGTGGFTFTNLSRLLAGTQIPIHLFDGDSVEPKNLKRQQFSKQDISKKKANALIQTGEETILDHSPYVSHDEYITDSDEFVAEILMSLPDNGCPIIISAVDNVATRKLINQALDLLEDYIAIDSGNNNQGGQVVWTTNRNVISKPTPFSDGYNIKVANMLEVYPELQNITDENPGIHRSCDEVVESEPQAMMANSRNGDIIANLVMSFIHNRPLVGNVFESSLEDFTTKTRTVTQ